jgi:hypothetical protein
MTKPCKNYAYWFDGICMSRPTAYVTSFAVVMLRTRWPAPVANNNYLYGGRNDLR